MPTSNSSLQTAAVETLERLQQFDTCSVSNAIEQFNVRPRNEGFINDSVHCVFPHLAPVVGYAVTARIRSSSTPISGRCYFDRADWWSYVLSIPAPRFIVAQDVDDKPGRGALLGEVHAHICKALNCSAWLTNGSVRDLAGIKATGFQVFAGGVAVSHAYAHVVEYGQTVEIAGLRIDPGDLLHGDQHGVHSIPISIATEIPRKVTEMAETEKELIEFCRSEEFSPRILAEKMRRASSRLGTPHKDSD